MPLHSVPESDLREHCKRSIEALELWLRRLIDDKLTAAWGANYLDAVKQDGSRVIRAELGRKLHERQSFEPRRFPRPIDSALIEEEISIICNPSLFAEHFSDALMAVFPQGADVARTFLQRLVMPRNALYHANPVSVHDAHRILCYTMDVIEGLKKYYVRLNLSHLFNVPTIVRISDSLGQVVQRSGDADRSVIDYSNDVNAYLRCGDTLSVEVDVDPTFAPNAYEIVWLISNIGGPTITGRKFQLTLTERYVSSRFCAVCRVISKQTWHKFGTHDDQVDIAYKVLPPISP
jgi:hypothetical protein